MFLPSRIQLTQLLALLEIEPDIVPVGVRIEELVLIELIRAPLSPTHIRLPVRRIPFDVIDEACGSIDGSMLPFLSQFSLLMLCIVWLFLYSWERQGIIAIQPSIRIGSHSLACARVILRITVKDRVMNMPPLC